MKVGVIGVGIMGENHVRIYSDLKSINEVFVFDLDNEKIKQLQSKEYGATICDSMEELFEKVDAVSICVPTRFHFETTKKAIEKEVHCLIEKPITLTVSEGEELLKLLENKNLIVGVGHIERFNPIIDEIKKIIKKPLYIEIRRHNPASTRITDSTVVEDLMIHDIDIIFNAFFDSSFGTNERMKKSLIFDSSFGTNERFYKIHSMGNRDICKTLIKFNSSFVSMSASRKSSKKIRSMYIEEEEFTIEGDFMNQEIYVYKKPEKYSIVRDRYAQENIIEKVLVNKVEPLKEELKTFIDCVKNGHEFTITPSQALNNLKICEEIVRLNGIL